MEPFDQLKAAYPKRSGSQRWGDAKRFLNRLLNEGETIEDILAGVERYKAWAENEDIIGTVFVQQAATFLGRNEGWREDWEIPKPKPKAVDKMDDGELLAEATRAGIGTHGKTRYDLIHTLKQYREMAT